MTGSVVTIERPPQPIESAPGYDFIEGDKQFAHAINLSELPEDEAIKNEAERRLHLAPLVGATAIQASHEQPSVSGRSRNLKESLERAEAGDKLAEKSAKINILTDAVERTMKVENVIEVEIEVAPDWETSQFGNTTDDVNRHSLMHAADIPEMRGRVIVEAHNNQRIKRYNKAGMLKNHYFVVFSCVDDQLDEAGRREAGFFEDTMSLSMQATTESDSKANTLVLQSAFVAGVEEAGGERFDIDTVVKIGALFGVDYRGKSTTEIMDMPLLIHKDFMKDGIVDLVKLYDELVKASDEGGGNIFFGVSKGTEETPDYIEHQKFCKRRQEALSSTIDKIYGHLIAELPTFHTPMDACRSLDRHSHNYMFNRAIYEDTTIDARVFGSVAAPDIEAARYHAARGDMVRALHAEQKAYKTAESNSCPTGARRRRDGKEGPEGGDALEGAGAEENELNSSLIECSCPYCDAKVIIDPCASIVSCYDCKALVVGGEVKYEGDGGTKAREVLKNSPIKSLATLIISVFKRAKEKEAETKTQNAHEFALPA